jgi:hypothetical protein
MNPDKTTLRALLDDVLPASGKLPGPNCAQVLVMLHRERARRRYLRSAAAILTISALALCPLLWKNHPTEATPVATTTKQPVRIVCEHVNDEQLLTLLQGTPAALMEWPNGDRTVIVVGH